jgi:GTP pyrophosphokinase
MLHDWLEDVPGATGDALERDFGARVRRIVEACTDTTQHPKPPRHARKQAFIARIAHEPVDAKLVCAADKLHNASTLVRDLRLHGPSTMDRFRGGREGTLWYYRAVADALATGWEHWILGELRDVVEQCERLAR